MRFATAACLAFLLAAAALRHPSAGAALGTPLEQPDAGAAFATPLGSLAPAGLKLTVRKTMSVPGRPESHVIVRTQYIRADRSRAEYRDVPPGSTEDARRPQSVWITRCDVRQSYVLDFAKREYDWIPLRPLPTRAQFGVYAAWWGARREPPREPTVLIEMTTRDTGERQTMFGRTARRVITTRKQIPVASPARGSSAEVTDGWYIDLDTSISCERSSKAAGVHAVGYLVNAGDKNASFTFKDIGPPETGFLVDGHTTSRSTAIAPNGSAIDFESTSDTVVTELTEESLPDALFEIPPGFRQRPVSFSELWNRYWDQFKAGMWRLLF